MIVNFDKGGGGMRTYLTHEQANELLPEGETVHVIINLGTILTGADWGRAELLAEMRKEGIVLELTGRMARETGHGICAHPENARQDEILFIETDREKMERMYPVKGEVGC